MFIASLKYNLFIIECVSHKTDAIVVYYKKKNINIAVSPTTSRNDYLTL